MPANALILRLWSSYRSIALTCLFFPGLAIHFPLTLLAAEDLPALFQKAEARSQARQFSDALALYEKVLKADPSFLRAYPALVSAYTALGDAQGAVIFMESLFLEHPDKAEVLYGLGCALYNVKKFQEANTYFEKAIKLKPDLAEAWNNSAAVYHFIIRDYDRAREYYDRAIAISTQTNNARVLEIAKENRAHLPQAKQTGEQTLPKDLTIDEFINRFVSSLESNDTRTIERLVAAQKRNSEQAIDWFIQEALNGFAKGQGESEKKFIAMGTRLEKEYGKAFDNASRQSRVTFYNSLTEEQKHTIYQGETLLRQGFQQEEQGLAQKALATYQEARVLFERGHDLEGMGRVLLSQGNLNQKMKDYPRARETYKAALDYFVQANDQEAQALALSSLGITCYHLGNHAEALDFLKRSSDMYRTLVDEESEKKVNQNIRIIESKNKQ